MARVTVTSRAAGDLRAAPDGTRGAREAVVPGPWATTRQVHGARVLEAAEAGGEGDAMIGRPCDRPAMLAADCALLGLVSRDGVVAAVHAGWRGLAAGVIEETARAARGLGAEHLLGVRGACIGPECYEFGEDDLALLTARYGDRLAATTSDGRPALDLAAGVREACERAGIELVHEIDECTACSLDEEGAPRWFSHRGRGDAGRHALVVSAPG